VGFEPAWGRKRRCVCVRVYDNENESPKAGNNFHHEMKTAVPICASVCVCVLGRVQIHASTAMLFSITIASLNVNPIRG
jgi:hypothetical protein